jgi:hypothetical protein
LIQGDSLYAVGTLGGGVFNGFFGKYEFRRQSITKGQARAASRDLHRSELDSIAGR